MRIVYSDGSFAEAIVFRLVGSKLRAAVAGSGDLAEFTLVSDSWFSESGQVVTFEFLSEASGFGGVLPDVTSESEHFLCVVGPECLLRRLARASNDELLA